MVMTPLFVHWRPSSMENTNGDEEKGSDGLMMMSCNEQTGAAAAAMTSSRGVRKNAKVIQKRIPQRGLGVAQLERLRLEERWKKMTEQVQIHHQQQNQQNQQNPFQFQLPFSSFLNNQIGGTSTASTTSATNIVNTNTTSFVDQWRPLCFGPDSQNLGGNGGSGLVSNMGTSQYHHFGSNFNDQRGSSNPFFVENNGQTYGQTLLFHQCLSSNCLICFEKRRSEAAMLSEHIAGFNQEKMMRNHVELMRAPATTMTTSNQGSDRFLELALGSQTSRPMMNGNLMINKPAEFCSSFGPKVVQNQEIEVMGVHRKINNNTNYNNNKYNTTNNMGSVIREYNFFPTHNGNNSTGRSSGSNKDYHNQFCSSTITSVGAEATEGSSPVVLSDQLEPSYTTNTDTKCLDLSLKLSCYT